MSPAFLPLLLNVFVTGMFMASFLTIAHLNPEFGRTRWIALSYAIGMLTPLSEVLLPLAPVQTPFMITSYASFLTALAIMSPALSVYYGRRPNWPMAGAIVAAGLGLRWLIWGGQRDDLVYEFLYQFPSAVASAACMATILRHGRGNTLDRALAGMFAVISLHFLLKPIAAHLLGSGATAADYVNSAYAMVSQVTTGVLLIAAGLLLLINVLQTVVQQNRTEAMSDALTGLPNRRALHEAFEQAVAAGGRGPAPAAVAILDIDLFKQVNDLWGHEQGDAIIRAVAACLDANRPANATIARIGGEEFVALLPAQDESLARLTCEAFRLAVSHLCVDPVPAITISVGVTTVIRGEDLSEALRRADRGLYQAKRSGRDRCVFEPAGQAAGKAVLRIVR